MPPNLSRTSKSVSISYSRSAPEKNYNQSCSSKKYFGLIKMTLGLVCVSCSLSEWQAVKLTFFAHWGYTIKNSLIQKLSHLPSPLLYTTFLILHQLSAQGNGFLYLFVHLFSPGFKGSTGSVVQEKNTDLDKLTQVRFIAFFNAVG